MLPRAELELEYEILSARGASSNSMFCFPYWVAASNFKRHARTTRNPRLFQPLMFLNSVHLHFSNRKHCRFLIAFMVHDLVFCLYWKWCALLENLLAGLRKPIFAFASTPTRMTVCIIATATPMEQFSGALESRICCTLWVAILSRQLYK